MSIDLTISLWAAFPLVATVAVLAVLINKFSGPYHGDYNFGGAIDALIWLIGLLFVVVIWLVYFLVA